MVLVQRGRRGLVHAIRPSSAAVRRYRRAGRWLLGALVLTALVGCSGDEEIRDESGAVVNPGQASVFELQVGDCLDPGEGLSGEVSDIEIVPCDDPHTQEVFGLVDHPDDAYPGAQEIASFADRACLTELEADFGLTVDDGLYVSYLLPTFDGWNTGGDRQVTCVLVFPDREDVTGSVVAGTAQIEPVEPAPPEQPGEDDDPNDDGDVEIDAARAPVPAIDVEVGGIQMGQAVCAGAQMMCTFGTAPSVLSVLPMGKVTAGGPPAATIQDNKPFVNIPPFAMCMSLSNPTVASATAAALGVLTPMPCLPVIPAPWAPGSATVTIANQPALNNMSKVNCAYGGAISVVSPGQFTVSVP